MRSISQLSPKYIWEIFDAITQVPRPSKMKDKIAKYLIEFATQHNLPYQEDEVGNVLISAPATPGYEDRPTVVLQSHMDMVCEKRGDVTIDFKNDPITTRIEGDWVMANGTTLGADCGIGMAAQMAVMIDPEVEHPAIEALFTVDEETGLTGAFGLSNELLKGRYLINLDSEDEGEIFIGCAGGGDTVATFTYTPEAAPAAYGWMSINVGGLKGGHSGDNINDGLGNSNRIVARLINKYSDEFAIRLAHFDGGNLRNAIPREATAVVGVPAAQVEAFKAIAEEYAAEIANELQYTDNGFVMSVAETAVPECVADQATSQALIKSVCAAPNGVLGMSYTLEGLVETSTNLASVKFVEGNKIVVGTSQRSSVNSARAAASEAIVALFTLAGAEVTSGDPYPGWAPNRDSRLLDVTVESYKRLFGEEPKVRAIHAGLECGLFLEKYPDLDMVSFGPTLRGVHSPDERLNIPTVDKFWALLLDTLKSI